MMKRNDELDQIEARAAAATQDEHRWAEFLALGYANVADGIFIAHAHSDVKKLASDVRRLEGEKHNLCMLIRSLLASKHLKHDPDVVRRAKDYLRRVDGWGDILREKSPG